MLAGGALPLQDGATALSDDDVIDAVYATARMPLDEIRAMGGTIHEEREVEVVAPEADADGRFAVAPDDVVAELAEVMAERDSADLLPDYDPSTYPYRLVSRRLKHVLNSLGTELPVLAAVSTTNYAFIHPDDMAELGAEAGGLVVIESPSGSVTGVVEKAPEMKRGVIAMSHAWGGLSLTDEKVRDEGSPTNRLIVNDVGYDRITGMAIQSAIPVRVRVRVEA